MWPSIIAEKSCKGLGKLAELILGPCFREKEYRDSLRKAQARTDAKAVEDGRIAFDGKKLIPAAPLPDISPTALLLVGQAKEAQNINDSLSSAAAILKDMPDANISDEPVDPDWFTRWRREASAIGNAELQGIWGRILAEEVKTPNSISLRTLDILKNITLREAQQFLDIVPFVLDDIFVCSEKRLPPSFKINDILDLIDMGLLTSSRTVRSSGRKEANNFRVFEGAGYTLYIKIIRRMDPVSGIALSRAGIEILRIADRRAATPEEVVKICDIIRSSTPNGIEKMRAVPPGQPFATLIRSIIYHWPYESRRNHPR